MTKPRFFKIPSAQPKQKENSVEKAKDPQSAGKLSLGMRQKVGSYTGKTAAASRAYRKFASIKTAALVVLGIAVGISSNGISAFVNGHVLSQGTSADAATYTLVNGYATINGNYVDCSGNIDNDMAHHTTDPGDTDPAHHVGQNCPSDTVVGKALSGSVSSTTQVPVSNPAPAQPAPAPSPAPAPAGQASSCGQVGTDAFVGCYFASKNFANLKLIRTDSQINFDWGNGSPDPIVPTDNFSAVWQGSFAFNGGTYTFKATADDGIRVSVDGNVLLDKMVDQPSTTYTASADLGSGRHTVKVEYYENGGGAVVKVGWTQNVTAPAQSTPDTSPASNLSHSSGNIFSGVSMYTDPYMHSKRQADAWRNSRPGDAALLDKIASQPNAFWFGGWNNDVQADAASVANAAAAKGQVPVMIIYNVPNRDCGGYSAGGTQTSEAYKNFVSAMARGIGSNKAAVIVEPDGLANIDCMSSQDQQTRLQLISYAVNAFKALPNTAVYIDAGNPRWVGVDEMAKRLNAAGVGQANGFALNVSNFVSTGDNISYGTQLSQKVGGKHFIIDTSRNGNGPTPDSEWCNPPGRALGVKPTANTGNGLVDAFIWAKEPGGSDGNCNGGPAAGQWWADYALGLAQRASW